MKTTKIEWTDKTWNPITGCNKISVGCQNCYAEAMARRLQVMNQKKYSNGFNITMHEDSLNEPKQWKKPHNIFVCSMSDIFHEKVPFEFVDKIMEVIISTPHHNYQVLTKRAERMNEYYATREVPHNVWLGVTVESLKVKHRIDYLRDINATIKFLSCEPLLEDLGNINLKGIHWIIVGGESGPRARPMQASWVESIQHQADIQKSSFFFKQWGTWGSDGVKRSKKANGKLINGKVFQELPSV